MLYEVGWGEVGGGGWVQSKIQLFEFKATTILIVIGFPLV